MGRALLQAMIAEPNASQRDWATATGRSKGRVNSHLQKLRGEKLVEVMLGKWTVTAKGRKAALDDAQKAKKGAEREDD